MTDLVHHLKCNPQTIQNLKHRRSTLCTCFSTDSVDSCTDIEIKVFKLFSRFDASWDSSVPPQYDRQKMVFNFDNSSSIAFQHLNYHAPYTPNKCLCCLLLWSYDQNLLFRISYASLLYNLKHHYMYLLQSAFVVEYVQYQSDLLMT